MSKKTGVTLFDLNVGELFSFGYDLNTVYQLIGFNSDNNAIVRAQRDGAHDETANPYYDNIVRMQP